MPVFKVADEPAHYEMVQYRAETFHAPHIDNSEKIEKVMHAGAPKEVQYLWDRVFHNDSPPTLIRIPIEVSLAKMALDPANRVGNGQTPATGYPGFYYWVAAAAYQPFRTSSVLDRIGASRFVSNLFGVLAVVMTYLAARCVVNSRALAVAAAVIVMLEPMASQMTAAVNNDAGVIGLAALVLYVQMLILMRAPRIPPWRLGLLLAMSIGAIIFTKPHGFAMLPGAVALCGWIAIENFRSWKAWWFCLGTVALIMSFVVALMAPMWMSGGSMVPASTAAAKGEPLTFLNFLQQLEPDYYGFLYRSAIGQFGWLDYSLGGHWFSAIDWIWTVGRWGLVVLAARIVLEGRAPWGISSRGVWFSVLTALVAVGFILFAEYRFRLAGIIGVIQGRNFLFALPAGSIALVGCYGASVPIRFRTLSAVSLIVCALALHLGAALYVFRVNYGLG